MKSNLLNSLILAALALPSMAMAADAAPTPEHTFTANVGLVSDYIYRGLTQTSHSPALQGGVDYAHSSGFYAGLWGSNVSWIKDSLALTTGNKGIELDTYLGYKGAAADVNYDLGAVRYNYLGNGTADTKNGFATADTAEVYGAATYSIVTAKYSYSVLDGFLTTPNAKGTDYFDLTANYTLEESGVGLSAHVGRQNIKNHPLPSYSDYKLSATKDFSGYVVGAALTSTNAGPAWTYAKGGKWGKTVLALSVLRSF